MSTGCGRRRREQSRDHGNRFAGVVTRSQKVKTEGLSLSKGIIIWAIFLAVIAVGILISRKIKREIIENGIETEAVVSRIVEDGSLEDIDINVYVTFVTEDGEEIEAVLSNPRGGLEEGDNVRIKYHPKYKANARLV